jgi:hypothetical protein
MAGLRNQKVKNRAEAQSESEKDGDTTELFIRSHPTTELRSVIGFHVRILARIPEWLTQQAITLIIPVNAIAVGIPLGVVPPARTRTGAY